MKTKDGISKGNKRSIEWHKECFNDRQCYYKTQLEQLKRLTDSVNRLGAELRKYELQIQRAEKEKRDGFDAERYLPKEGSE